MNNFYNFIQHFSDWSRSSLLYGAGLFLVLLVIQEFVIASLIKKKISQAPSEGSPHLSVNLFRILRFFLRLEILYIFLKVVEHSQGSVFPWNLIYGVITSAVLSAGILIPVYKLLNLAIETLNFKAAKSESDTSDSEAIDSEATDLPVVRILSTGKGLRFTLFFLAFTVVLWNILGLLPQEIENTEIFRLGLLLNGIIIAFLILLVIQKVFKTTVAVLDKTSGNSRITIIVRSLSKPVQFITVACILLWFKQMTLEIPGYSAVLDKIINLIFLSSVILFIFQIVEALGMRLRNYSDKDTNNVDKTFVEMLRMIIRIVIILAGVFSAVQIITGKPLTALLAGLGIGGLAIALAAQDTLKNFFGSIMIMTDKPFKIGERVHVNGYDGTIEAIGFRSTRIRTLVGHQVIIPNDQMASSSIENIGRRPHIRRLTNITVTYGTTFEKMEQALEIIKNILENHEGMNDEFPPRVYFNEYNPDSLNIMMLYWYFPPDYWKFMDFSERVNFRIMKEFSDAGIEFAFPTSTTYLEQSDGQSLRFSMDNKDNG